MSIVILGASSGPGRLLFDQLAQEGEDVTGIARHQRDIDTTGTRAKFLAIDAEDTDALQAVITPQDILVHCASPELLTALAKRTPSLSRLIAIGSTRIYTRFPDDKCRRLGAMSHELWMRDVPTTLLHPTMIYGAPGLNNIERVVKIARLSPVIPLPEDGRSLIQPVHAADVVSAIRACLADETTIGRTIALPGHSPITYRAFIELCIELSGARCRVISLPYFLVSALAPTTHLLPGVPVVTGDEVQRLLEDKAFDVEDMTRLIGRAPIDIRAGLTEVMASLRTQT